VRRISPSVSGRQNRKTAAELPSTLIAVIRTSHSGSDAMEPARRGLYCDNTSAYSYNLLMTEAYQRPDGQIQPSASMWNLREYHKRLWVLEQQYQPLTQFR